MLHLLILNSVPDPSAFVQIIGEDAREFIAGLADNIVLEKDRAARMVTAAVAARTRSWLLQAWVRICLIVLEHLLCTGVVCICVCKRTMYVIIDVSMFIVLCAYV